MISGLRPKLSATFATEICSVRSDRPGNFCLPVPFVIAKVRLPSIPPSLQVRMIQAVLPHMRAAQSGHIINVTSLVGFSAIPFTDAYSASKFAVRWPPSAQANALCDLVRVATCVISSSVANTVSEDIKVIIF